MEAESILPNAAKVSNPIHAIGFCVCVLIRPRVGREASMWGFFAKLIEAGLLGSTANLLFKLQTDSVKSELKTNQQACNDVMTLSAISHIHSSIRSGTTTSTHPFNILP